MIVSFQTIMILIHLTYLRLKNKFNDTQLEQIFI